MWPFKKWADRKWPAREPAVAPPSIKFFFNGPGQTQFISNGVNYIPSKGDVVFCYIGGVRRWVVQGIRTEMATLVTRYGTVRSDTQVMTTEIVVILDPLQD